MARGSTIIRLSGPLRSVVLIVIGLLWVGVAATALYLPDAMRSAALDTAYRSNLEVADQIKITRGYYTRSVVAKALNSGGALTPTSSALHRNVCSSTCSENIIRAASPVLPYASGA